MSSPSRPSDGDRTSSAGDASRWGVPAPLLLRAVAASAWLALCARLVATALPGARSGIGPWIHRADNASSLVAQLSALLGSSLLVLLVVGTLAERGLGYVYRLIVVPTAAAVLMLVMLSSTMRLEPEASLTLGVACLALSTGAATVAMNSLPSRAQGMVVSLVTLGAASRLAVRVLSLGAAHHDSTWVGRVAWIATIGEAFDACAIALAAARLRAEQRGRAAVALSLVLVLTLGVAWSALRGNFDGASTWQVLASRAMGDLAQSPVAFSTIASRYALEALALLLSASVVFWPGRISAGMMSAALAILARPSVDVPSAALVLAIAALVAPLSRSPFAEVTAAPRPDPAATRPAGADR